MVSRSKNLLQSLSSRLNQTAGFTTSTTPKMRAHAVPINKSELDQVKKRMKKGDFVPVCVALGMIAVSTSLGLYTAMGELKDSPTVRVRKSRRETLPEVVEPEVVVEEAERFMTRSLFRKIAHLQEFDAGDSTVSPNSSPDSNKDFSGGVRRAPHV
ncbi:uncharacterized protein LOC115729196 [Rhodamnia argentea]|uniref:Uncharacterized protein LOC115729196 n=1 Tax=Rhodamnia argentea TaxID=178133 RepID=A0A8B8MZE6_9MYRT|nr:uncharacterized protein LOC115729196 [Rhodamnia argentea]